MSRVRSLTALAAVTVLFAACRDDDQSASDASTTTAAVTTAPQTTAAQAAAAQTAAPTTTAAPATAPAPTTAAAAPTTDAPEATTQEEAEDAAIDRDCAYFLDQGGSEPDSFVGVAIPADGEPITDEYRNAVIGYRDVFADFEFESQLATDAFAAHYAAADAMANAEIYTDELADGLGARDVFVE